MRAGNTYRGARRKEAKALGLRWRYLDMEANPAGMRIVRHPFHRGGKPATREAVDAARAAVLAAPAGAPRNDGCRFDFAELARLRAERGVGSVRRVNVAVRATFVHTKRAK